MKTINLIGIAAITAALSFATPASAESLSGAEFKKLVIGNTLKHEFTSGRTGREFKFMYYFIDAKTLMFSSAGSLPTGNEPWNVTDNGKWCRVAAKSGRTICLQDFQVKGNKLTGIGRRDRKHVLTLMKGKHEY